MTDSIPCLDAALDYLKRGWSVIPIENGGKRPVVVGYNEAGAQMRFSWERFQESLPTEADVREWFRLWPNANIAVVTGAVSRIVILDVDVKNNGLANAQDLFKKFGTPVTPRVQSPSGGFHYYFRHPGRPVPRRIGVVPGVDILGDGGYAVVPPSTLVLTPKLVS